MLSRLDRGWSALVGSGATSPAPPPLGTFSRFGRRLRCRAGLGRGFRSFRFGRRQGKGLPDLGQLVLQLDQQNDPGTVLLAPEEDSLPKDVDRDHFLEPAT